MLPTRKDAERRGWRPQFKLTESVDFIVCLVIAERLGEDVRAVCKDEYMRRLTDRKKEWMDNMQDEPLVSIIIPTYRRPKELRKAIESAISQTYTNLEIIVSNNDCENEETNALCREFAAKDKRVLFHVQPVNLGAWGNGNFLWNIAKGEYFLGLCDDDWISENFIESSLRVLRSDPNCVIVHGGYVYHYEGRQPHTRVFEDNVSESYQKRILAVACGNLPSHFMTRTSFWKGHVWIEKRSEKRYGEDWPMVAKLAFLGNIRSAPDALYHKVCPPDHDEVYYADLFDSPAISKKQVVEEEFLSILDSIAYDSFYDGKLEQRERMRLIAYLGAKRNIEGIKYVRGLRPCLRYLSRHPLALFKKKANWVFEIPNKRRNGDDNEFFLNVEMPLS